MAQSDDMDMATMTFADHQLAGVYRTGAYRKMVRSFSSNAVDAKAIAELEEAAKSPRGNDPTSMSHYALFSAAATCSVFVANMVSATIDTLDVRQWLSLHEALVCANRLVCVPDYTIEEGVSVPNIVMSVALICDIMTRCADRSAVSSAPLPDFSDETVTRRAFGIYRDIVCGRVGFWISAVDDFITQCCLLMDKDFGEILDSWRGERMAEYVKGLAEAFSISERDASNVFVSQVISMSQLFDVHQASVWDDSAADMSLPSESEMSSIFDAESAATFFKSVPEIPCDKGPHLCAFCEASGVSAIDSTFMVTRRVHAEVVGMLAEVAG